MTHDETVNTALQTAIQKVGRFRITRANYLAAPTRATERALKHDREICRAALTWALEVVDEECQEPNDALLVVRPELAS